MAIAHAATNQRGVVLRLRAVEEKHHFVAVVVLGAFLHFHIWIRQGRPLLQRHPRALGCVRLVQEEPASAGFGIGRVPDLVTHGVDFFFVHPYAVGVDETQRFGEAHFAFGWGVVQDDVGRCHHSVVKDRLCRAGFAFLLLHP
ncbi:hypothetical protein D3C74_411390 [compost metagenome]